MSRVSVAEHVSLPVFLARGLFRKLVSRVSGRVLVNWPFPAKTDRLVISPQDLRTADATRASEIYAGRFVFAGKVVTCDARSPFEIAPPSEDWAIALLGFGWLRHLRAADSAITRANARALVDEWITSHSTMEPIAWRPEVMARRIMSWLSQAPLLLDDSDVRFYRRFIRSLTRHVRQLRLTAADAPDGVPRLQAVMPRIVDNFQVYLRELRVEDLRGSGGIYRLREELLARVNAAAAPIKVVDVLFKEMLVQ